MKKVIIISSFAAFLLFGLQSSFNSVNAQAKTEMKTGVYYTCKMHPEVHSNKPGNCPKCGMKLVKKEVTTKDVIKTDSTKMKHTKTMKM
jgi:Cu(I)/Ag(I) efflux system membrane fusion protein